MPPHKKGKIRLSLFQLIVEKIILQAKDAGKKKQLTNH
jgi:hypothetical protein